MAYADHLTASGHTGCSMSTTNRRRGTALYYATRDGQSRRIAEHIFRRLAESETLGSPQDVAVARPAAAELAAASVVVLVAAVRYGRHLPEADCFLAAYRSLESPPPLALASVNLTARKPAKTTATGNPYLRKIIARHRLAPALAVAFAGRLDYRRYGWLDRQIIRFIMLLTRGPTDPETCVEYTSWRAVDEFAARIADVQRRI
jgi:menaquinone-dependent protoporphyrinogen oxidase